MKCFIDKITALISGLFLLLTISANAEINQNRPPLSLTLEQVKAWTPSSVLADKENVSTVALQPRFIARLEQHKEQRDQHVKVLIAPDGMNNLANYLSEQKQFNLYNFSHWSHIDTLNWFAGTATETVSIPARPWVDVAHKNGVKVLGSVFLAVAQYGGSADTVAKLVVRDQQGGFPVARKLVDIAKFYGFDGWLMNQETDLTLVKDDKGQVLAGIKDREKAAFLAQEIQAFMQYLTLIAPEEMEVHWYDAMLINGEVKWQNELNHRNALFFQNDTNSRVSDAIFLNYWWHQEMAINSHQQAKALKRSPYDVYFGADLWPERNAQRMFTNSDWLHALFPGDGNKGLGSIALFGNNANYSFSGDKRTPAFSHFKQNKYDYRTFYQAETRLFAGDKLNLLSNNSAVNWPGIGFYVPAKSTLMALPFSTSFNTGHGLFKAKNGKKVIGEWHDVSQQDILPTWQFAMQGNPSLSVFYDFDLAYQGGSSLAIQADLSKGQGNIPLYQTKFLLSEKSAVKVTYAQHIQKQILSLVLQTNNNESIEVPLTPSNKTWSIATFSLNAYAGKTVKKISIKVNGSSSSAEHFSANIGMVEIN